MKLKISGVTKNKIEREKLVLYKYESLFSRKFIDNIPIINGEFNYETNIEEVDSYLLLDERNGTFILFVWDQNIFFIIEDNLSYSIVENSPLTQKMKSFENDRYIKSILPAIKQDSLINTFRKSHDLNNLLNKRILDSLYIISDKIHKDSKLNFWEITFNFIDNNPNSFLSLYYLTFTGEELINNEYIDRFRESFSKISIDLKKHSRALIYQ